MKRLSMGVSILGLAIITQAYSFGMIPDVSRFTRTIDKTQQERLGVVSSNKNAAVIYGFTFSYPDMDKV